MKLNTACECPAAGWCQRHGINKDRSQHRLCQYSPDQFSRWENGNGLHKQALPHTDVRATAVKQFDLEHKVAIIIVSHNYGQFLQACIDSVLNQTIPAIEIVVVDDASTDNTRDVAIASAKYGVRYERVEYRNVHQTRRHGMEITRAGVLCFLDADDILSPDYLEMGLAEFTDYRIAVVYSDCQLFGTRSEYITYPSEYSQAKLEQDNFIHAGSLVRREALEQSQVFSLAIDPHVTQSDWFIWKHTLRGNWLAKKQKSVYHYRQHENNWSRTKRRESSNYFKYAALNHETISLCVSLSGRRDLWPDLLDFLRHQTWPHDQIILHVLDTSQDEVFGNLIRSSLAQLDYPRFSYASMNYELLAQSHSNKFTARIYNYFATTANSEFVWFLQDNILPPVDVAENLLHGFAANVASVAAPYRRPSSSEFCAWDLQGHCFQSFGFGYQEIGGNGFGCTIVRGSLLCQTLFVSPPKTPDFAARFYGQLQKTNWSNCINWDVPCDQFDTLAESLTDELSA